MKKKSAVKVLDKALDILEAVGASEQGKSLAELVAELGLPPATLHRHLQDLVRRGYVEQDPDSKLYFLGLRVLSLRAQAIRAIQMVARARPFLRDLMLATNCTAYLAVYRDREVVYLDRVDAPTTVPRFVPVGGMRAPAYCIALGKVLLAALSREELEDYLATTELVPFTPHTLTDRNQLREHLSLVRERDYALDMEEQSLGSWCIAAPVRDYTGRTIAAISITIKDKSLAERLESMIPLVCGTALKISRELGYRPPSNESVLDLDLVGQKL
jgi:DNA-binding IclR family transcriptional regulator